MKEFQLLEIVSGEEKDKKEWQLLFVLLQSNMHKELSEIRRKSQLRTQEKIMKCL